MIVCSSPTESIPFADAIRRCNAVALGNRSVTASGSAPAASRSATYWMSYSKLWVLSTSRTPIAHRLARSASPRPCTSRSVRAASRVVSPRAKGRARSASSTPSRNARATDASRDLHDATATTTPVLPTASPTRRSSSGGSAKNMRLSRGRVEMQTPIAATPRPLCGRSRSVGHDALFRRDRRATALTLQAAEGGALHQRAKPRHGGAERLLARSRPVKRRALTLRGRGCAPTPPRAVLRP
mmetsp:Transcript_10522/g.32387  ORF Transcript_10522/g.32387 Transcript_10522/m.32387 type:complete len:241 (-) Transcript_10522:52-774(-)